MITLRDVARASQVSHASVSIVLNNAPLARYIPDATKARILAAAQRLGYRPNQLARSLRHQHSHMVGLLVFDLLDPFCAGVLEGAVSSLYESSYLPILADVRNDRPRFERYLEMLLQRRVEGLVVLANWLFIDIAMIADLAGSRIPIVLVGTRLAQGGVRTVITDNVAGARLGLGHLFELGHRQIAFLRGPHALADAAMRWRGIQTEARRRKLALDMRLVKDLPAAPDAFSSFSAGQQLTRELLAGPVPFSALMAYDDMTALGAMRAVIESGRRVPDDCSILGFDDIAAAPLGNPPLSTIRQPMAQLGSCAVEWVLEEMQQPKQSPGVHPRGKANQGMLKRLPPELVVRGSTGRIQISTPPGRSRRKT